MIIERKEVKNIIKKEIDVNNLKNYDKTMLKEAEILLKEVLSYTSNSFDLITILRKNYTGNIQETFSLISKLDFQDVRFQCYYYAKELHRKLENIGLNPEFLTHKARLFALNSGDNIVKEAHISLILHNIKDNQILYTIFDPGLKIDVPISFYKNDFGNKLKKDKFSINILQNNDDNYPYIINIDGSNPYSYNEKPHNVYQAFNPDFVTTNIDDLLFPISYKVLNGYKAMNFSEKIKNRAYIILNHLSKYLEFCNFEDSIVYKYDFIEITRMGKSNLKNKLERICNKLYLDCDEIVEDVFFIIEIADELVNKLMDRNVVYEYFTKVRKR